VTIPLSNPIVASVAALCLVVACGRAGASHSVAGFGRARVQLLASSTATVELSRRHAAKSLTSRFLAATGADGWPVLTSRSFGESPLNGVYRFWGGPERAVIHLSGMRPIRVTRADSCQMARWAELQLLP
jgi:hypothetical protein